MNIDGCIWGFQVFFVCVCVRLFETAADRPISEPLGALCKVLQRKIIKREAELAAWGPPGGRGALGSRIVRIEQRNGPGGRDQRTNTGEKEQERKYVNVLTSSEPLNSGCILFGRSQLLTQGRCSLAYVILEQMPLAWSWIIAFHHSLQSPMKNGDSESELIKWHNGDVVLFLGDR